MKWWYGCTRAGCASDSQRGRALRLIAVVVLVRHPGRCFPIILARGPKRTSKCGTEVLKRVQVFPEFGEDL